MKKNYDSERVKQTKQTIKEIFLELYKEKTIDKISINEITNKAGFNRGTFYIHYMDIYDLLEQIEDEILLEFDNVGKQVLSYNLNKFDQSMPMPPMLELLEYINTKSNYFEALLGKNGTPSFATKIKLLMKQYLNEKITSENIRLGNHKDYLLEYIASANQGMIISWLQTGRKTTPKELSLFLSRTTIEGLLNLWTLPN